MNKHVENVTPITRIEHKSIEAALSAAQADLVDPIRDKKVDAGKMKFNYADLEGVMKSLRPVMFQHGLSVTQRTKIEGSMIVLITELRHETGGIIDGEYPVASTNTNHQQMGAGMTYARRQAISAMFGISGSDDMDAHGTGNINDGPKEKMSSHQARQEVNWEAIQKTIDNADTFERLVNCEKRVDANKGIWPDSYISSAAERIFARRLEIANTKMAAKDEIDELDSEFSDIEAILEGKVPWEEIAAIHKMHQTRILG